MRIVNASLLIDARQAGMIPSVRVPLEHHRARGMRLSQSVWEQLLAQSGELGCTPFFGPP
jgi:hypothetical protein